MVTFTGDKGQLGFLMGLGQSADFTATVKPMMPGSFHWWTSSTNVVIANPNAPTATVKAVALGVYVEFGVRFLPARPNQDKDVQCTTNIATNSSTAGRDAAIATPQIKRFTLTDASNPANSVSVGD